MTPSYPVKQKTFCQILIHALCKKTFVHSLCKYFALNSVIQANLAHSSAQLREVQAQAPQKLPAQQELSNTGKYSTSY